MGLETALRGSVVVKGYCKDGISRGGMQISVLISMFGKVFPLWIFKTNW